MSATFDGAVIQEQGVEFGVLAVKRHVLSSHAQADEVIAAAQAHLGVPVVLVAQEWNGRPIWYGRTDIARFMSGVPLTAIPWKRITFH